MEGCPHPLPHQARRVVWGAAGELEVLVLDRQGPYVHRENMNSGGLARPLSH